MIVSTALAVSKKGIEYLVDSIYHKEWREDKCQEKEISIIQMQELEYLAIAFNREKSNLEV